MERRYGDSAASIGLQFRVSYLCCCCTRLGKPSALLPFLVYTILVRTPNTGYRNFAVCVEVGHPLLTPDISFPSVLSGSLIPGNLLESSDIGYRIGLSSIGSSPAVRHRISTDSIGMENRLRHRLLIFDRLRRTLTLCRAAHGNHNAQENQPKIIEKREKKKAPA